MQNVTNWNGKETELFTLGHDFAYSLAGQIAFSIRSGNPSWFYSHGLSVSDCIAEANKYWESDIGVEMTDSGYIIFGKVPGGPDTDCMWEVVITTTGPNPYLPPQFALNDNYSF